MKILLTGAHGFLGWHTRVRLQALTGHEVVPVGRDEWADLPALAHGCDTVVHLAGVNRGEAEDVEHGNTALARDLATALTGAPSVSRVVFANTIRAGEPTPYGRGKADASTLIAQACAERGTTYVDLRLPNLFGEHARANYNGFVATFVERVLDGDEPEVEDRPIALLSGQRAAAAILDALDGPGGVREPEGHPTSVGEVLSLLREFHASYEPRGEIPDLSSDFRIDLFNTYRTASFARRQAILLTPHADARGHFVETVRCRGGEGQTSFSTTVPGVTRGIHYHLHKIERFAVIQGRARISLRRLFHDEIVDVHVTGVEPVAVDMPVGWAHDITNTGDDLLLTQFWSHELFRSEAPDTYPEPVRRP